jgi:hypothetical protein
METKTIAQLWEEMQEHLTSLNLERMIGRSSEGSTLNNFADDAKVRIPVLRDELSERCKNEFGLEARPISVGGMISYKLCNDCDWDRFGLAQAKEFSASVSFTVWHLEELQKEKKDPRVESHC